MFPPPPPPEIPKPDSLSSASVSPGAQQYSPSRATSPNSDDETGNIPPPPPTAASLPPRKVLGSDQAKRRLQAFAKLKQVGSPKIKSAATFSEEEEHQDAGVMKEIKFDKKKYPTVKEATPVMASIMKEETLSRDLVKKNMERKGKDVREDIDLRDLLNSRKKKDTEEKDTEIRRSRSREKVKTRKYSGESQSGGRQRDVSRSPSLNRSRKKSDLDLESSRNSRLDMFDDSPDVTKRRRKQSGDSSFGRKRNLSGDGRHSDSFDGDQERKMNRSRNRDLSPEGKQPRSFSRKNRRSSGGSSKHSGHSSPPASGSSGKKKLTKEMKWNMPDLMDEMKKKKARKDDLWEEKEKKSRKDIDLWEDIDKKPRKDIDLWEEKEKKSRKDIDLWELKHGKKEAEGEDEPSPGSGKLFKAKKHNKTDLVLIKATEENDYFEVKQANRDTSSLLKNEDGAFLEFPLKFMKETSQGVSYSFNLDVSKELYLEAKKSAKIRKSIDSMVFELENETKQRKHSGDDTKDKSDVSVSKKKKKLKGVAAKKEKKGKKLKQVKGKNEDADKKKKKVKGKKVKQAARGVSPEAVKKPKTPGTGSGVSLSAAGMSKLYSMAGYDLPNMGLETETKSKSMKKEELTPVKDEYKDERKGNYKDDKDGKYSPSTPLRDDRSPSPSLIADLSRLSDRRDDGPRLPKMKDSRSPSKVPIMRDGRSPLKDKKRSSVKDDDSFSKKHLKEKDQSPGHPRYSSPAGEGDTSPGIKYSPIRDGKESDRSFSSLDRDQDRSRNSQQSPGRRLDSPETRIFSPKSESSGGKKRRPRTPSPLETDKRSRGSSRRSPLPDGKFSPVRGRQGRTPEQDRGQRSPGRMLSPANRKRSPGSPARKRTPVRHSSPRLKNRSPGRVLSPSRKRSPSPRNKSPGRISSPSSRARSPRRRSLTPDRRKRPDSPRGRANSPARRSSPRRRSLSAGPRRKFDSPGRRPMSPRPQRKETPDRRPMSPGSRRRESPDRRPLSPGQRRRDSLDRRPLSPGPRRRDSPDRRPLSPGPRRRDSPDRRPLSPGPRRRDSPDRRPLSPGPRRRDSPDRRPLSPGPRRRDSPGRRPLSPERRSTGRRPLSPPGRRRLTPPPRRPRSRSPQGFSPRRRSPDRRRGPISPGRPRHPRTPSYSPGPRRSRSPIDRRLSPRGRDRDYDRRSPDRRRYSPDRRHYSPHYDMRDRNVPDSTISDAELARQMPPPSNNYYKSRPGTPPLGPMGSGYDSPKRLSLDERLEREHGIKIENEPIPMDFSRPPPSFPGAIHPAPVLVQPQYAHHPPPQAHVAPVTPHVSQHVAAPSFSSGLPAMIPTYDDTAPPVLVKGPPYPGSQKVANEKEQAMIAAQAVQSKLQEMQALQKEEEKRKKEQKMAERIAMLEASQTEKKEEIKNDSVSAKASTGRILEEVEKQETEMKGEGEKKKRKREKDSPMLITLKPFYRPNDKKGVKKRKIGTPDYNEEDVEDEEFTPRSPVPLPDNSNLRPVLRPYMTKSEDKKSVKYADGVLPGQGSPDQSYSYAGVSASSVSSVPEASSKPAKKKKYKKVTITVITQHTGDTDSEDEPPPPPPPGSPIRYSYKELLMKYGPRQPVETTA